MKIHTVRAQVKLSCGRYFLDVNGVTVAVEGDPCRDYEVIDAYTPEENARVEECRPAYCTWNEERLERAASKINDASL